MPDVIKALQKYHFHIGPYGFDAGIYTRISDVSLVLSEICLDCLEAVEEERNKGGQKAHPKKADTTKASDDDKKADKEEVPVQTRKLCPKCQELKMSDRIGKAVRGPKGRTPISAEQLEGIKFDAPTSYSAEVIKPTDPKLDVGTAKSYYLIPERDSVNIRAYSRAYKLLLESERLGFLPLFVYRRNGYRAALRPIEVQGSLENKTPWRGIVIELLNDSEQVVLPFDITFGPIVKEDEHLTREEVRKFRRLTRPLGDKDVMSPRQMKLRELEILNRRQQKRQTRKSDPVPA